MRLSTNIYNTHAEYKIWTWVAGWIGSTTRNLTHHARLNAKLYFYGLTQWHISGRIDAVLGEQSSYFEKGKSTGLYKTGLHICRGSRVWSAAVSRKKRKNAIKAQAPQLSF
jgi:hypothetical protein